MPVFQYKAATAEGEVVTGTLNGNSREQVVTHIQSLGQIPIRVSEASAQSEAKPTRPRRGRRIKDAQIATLTQELAILLRAGHPLDRALGILASLAENDRLVQLVEDVRERVKRGSTLTDAVQAQGRVFNRFYINLLRAGESGSALEVVLERLAEHMEKSREVRDALISALLYPAILLFVVLISIFILLGYVVPQFTELFEGVGQVLPLPTRITIAVGEGLQRYGWIALPVIALAVLLLRRQFSKPASRYRWHGWFLRLPLAGVIIIKLEVARFARTLGTLLHNGVPLLKALSIVKDTVGNDVIARGLERVATSLKEGQSLAGRLEELARFPAFAVHMIRVGEESGQLEEILLQVASIYERETQTSMKRALTLMEPILVLVLSGIIAGVIVSILLAILEINQLVF